MSNKSSTLIYGLEPRVANSALKSTKELYFLTGDNTGNLAFNHAIDMQVKHDTGFMRWDKVASDPTLEVTVVPCANQVGEHVNLGMFVDNFEKLNTTVTAIGLGAQSGMNGSIPNVPEGTLKWLAAMARKAKSDRPNIGVRGPFTKKVLDHYGFADNTEVLGCPTLFINPNKNLGELIASNVKPIKRVAVTAGHQKWQHLKLLEQSLVNMVTATQGSYVAQSAFEMVALCRGEAETLEKETFDECKSYLMPDVDDEAFIEWTRSFGDVFFDISHWMEHYRKFDFVVGLRIHGVMLALQAGIPALCIVHDSRTLELCETMMVPYVKAGDFIKGMHIEDLQESFNFDPVAFDKNRMALGNRYLSFLEENGVTPTEHLVSLIKG